MLQNFGTALSREQMKNVRGGYKFEDGGGATCGFTTIDASCTCPAASCKCQSGVGLPSGTFPGCVSIWSDGSCNMNPSDECHG